MTIIKKLLRFKLVLVFAFTITTNISYSKEHLPIPNSILTGRVFDNIDHTAMEYVTITIFSKKDSTYLTGGITETDGSFSIQNLALGEPVFIKFRYIGYLEKIIDNLILNKEYTELGNIFLEGNASIMDEVVVRSEKALVENKVDKKVYNADQIISGGTGLDLLRNIPSVQVDENDNIAFRGQEGVTVLIDGRPISLSPASYLKMIPASSVDKIELIANPSARYDAEGMSGIINIITKKERQQGFNGSLNGRYGRWINNRWMGNTAINYNTKKINLHGAFNIDRHSASTFSYTEREVHLSDDTTDRLNSDGTGVNSSSSHVISGGIDYFPNKNNTLYASGRYNVRNLSSTSKLIYENIDEYENIILGSNRKGSGWGPMDNYSLNAGWQNTFGLNKSTLDFDVNYASTLHETNESISEDIADTDTYLTNTNGLEENTLFVNKLDLKIPVNDSTSIESGLKSTMRKQSSNLDVLILKNGEIENSSSGLFNYDQTVLAGYFSYEKQLHNVVFKLGLRGEYTNTDSGVLKDTLNFAKDYFQLFPSAFISYSLSPKSNLNFNYGRRINRPRMEQLNPFIYYSDRFLIEQGYPFLNPETTHVFELGFSRYSNKLNFDATVFYRSIKNKIRKYIKQEDLVSIFDYKNVEHSNLFGLESNITYKLNKKITIRYSLNLWSYNMKDEIITNNKTLNNLGSIMNLDFYFKFKNDWKFQLRNYYRPKYDVQQGYVLPRYALRIGLSKLFFNKQLKISLTASDILNTLNYHYRSTLITNYNFKANWDWESRVVYIAVNWSFGSNFKAKKKRRLSDQKVSDDGIQGI